MSFMDTQHANSSVPDRRSSNHGNTQVSDSLHLGEDAHVNTMNQQPQIIKGVDVTVFWDIENCAVPSDMRGFNVVTAIRKFVAKRQGILKNINAFGNLHQIKQDLRAELQQSGVLLHDVPPGKPSGADMALMVEFLKLVADHRPPHSIVLISADRDFSNVLNVLVFRGYEVTLIHLPNASEILKRAANHAIEWRTFLSGDAQSGTSASKAKKYSGDSVSTIANPNGAPNSPVTPNANVTSPKQKSSVDSRRNSNGSDDNFSVPKALLINDEKVRYFHLIKEALESLKKESFKPTEKAIEKTLKRSLQIQGKSFNSAIWKDVLAAVTTDPAFKVFGTEPKRIIYLATDLYGGVDPLKNPKKDFPEQVYSELRNFLREKHPIAKSGRFKFAEYIKANGPPSLQACPLAKIAQLVEVAISKKILGFSNGVVCSLPEKSNGSLPNSPIVPTSPSTNPVSSPEELSPEKYTVDDVKNEIIRFVESKKKVQIGTLSNHLIQKQMLPLLKSLGGVKQFIEDSKICVLRKDSNNGLYVCAKQNLSHEDMSFLQPLIEFVKSKNGRVNIGALSTFAKNRGFANRFDLYGGLKRYLESIDLFNLEADGTSCFVTFRNPEQFSDSSNVQSWTDKSLHLIEKVAHQARQSEHESDHSPMPDRNYYMPQNFSQAPNYPSQRSTISNEVHPPTNEYPSLFSNGQKGPAFPYSEFRNSNQNSLYEMGNPWLQEETVLFKPMQNPFEKEFQYSNQQPPNPINFLNWSLGDLLQNSVPKQ